MEAPAVRAAKAALWTTGSHHDKARRLYRHGLKTVLNWAIHRDIFIKEAAEMRAEFEKNRYAVDGATLLVQGITKLKKFEHPNPYIIPTEYGGSKWQRNVPLHEKAELVLDYGKEHPDY
mmetsp:Transcript_29904/g.41394  ORF Transcript_29904/g.41394 Transcript_29904/m.41394 type:complete len:119 (-) Transcript_29904:376-732(-)